MKIFRGSRVRLMIRAFCHHSIFVHARHRFQTSSAPPNIRTTRLSVLSHLLVSLTLSNFSRGVSNKNVVLARQSGIARGIAD